MLIFKRYHALITQKSFQTFKKLLLIGGQNQNELTNELNQHTEPKSP